MVWSIARLIHLKINYVSSLTVSIMKEILIGMRKGILLIYKSKNTNQMALDEQKLKANSFLDLFIICLYQVINNIRMNWCVKL